ncbi:hypothetical protein F5X96DRAFT_686875 [Biscogniauxia mediterranea]|nr:hypothetical protein F5X96DRAFT_686875 [Biscogniauxia mediterranea]
MFDVIWTDPKRELVGERIQRKEQENREREKEKSKRKLDNERHSISTTESSCSERGLGRLMTRNRRKTPTPTPSRAKSITSSPAKSTGDDIKGKRGSEYGVQSLLSSHDGHDPTTKPTDASLLPVQLPEIGNSSPAPSSRDSILSKWTQQSAATTGTLVGVSERDSATTTKSEHLIQSLGPSSFITKCTEVTVSPRVPGTSIDQDESEVHIISERVKPETPPLPDSPEEVTTMAFEEPVPLLSPSRLPQTPPPVELGNSPTIYTPGWNSNDRLSTSESWKPPHEWDCTPTKESVSPSYEGKLRISPSSQVFDHCLSPDLAALQREVRIMSAASPELMLANMKSAAIGPASDANIYKELEMNKKRWMFSALNQNGGYGDLVDRANVHAGSPVARHPPKILALYETQASASFLAALNSQALISHLSPNPISPHLFPNVRPLLVPAVSAIAGSRPLPPQLYSVVTCLNLPSLFPSTEIPPFLRHINRCLTVGGALHLTLIDPQPISASMGPKLRQWLFEKLLINLEQMFRTTYPSGTFPAWLAVARLRGKGSTIATLSVPAVPEYYTKGGGPKKQSDLKAEVRCLATRMLWQEIWGSFVHAERWWWDEEDIVQECIELETYWNYSHIVAVKEDR